MKLAWAFSCLFFGLQTLEAHVARGVLEKYPNPYFIESGSYDGVGILTAIDAGFKNIYSIDPSFSFYSYCYTKFAAYPFVRLVFGDSSQVMPLVLEEIDAPATFRLDAHHRGSWSEIHGAKEEPSTPLLMELEWIAQHPIKTHTILIDNLRALQKGRINFVALDKVIEKILSINPLYTISFENGILPNDVLVAVILK